jgi:hypothetical protein
MVPHTATEPESLSISSFVLLEIERCATDRGCTYIILVTEQGRTTTHRFYESMVYSPVEHKDFKKRL